MLSPFNERAVRVKDRLTTTEQDVYQWLLSYTEGSENEMLFSDENVIAERSDMKTMQPQTFLAANVINAWSCHLNHQERLRSQDSPSRFFFTTFPCKSTIVNTPDGWTTEQVRNAFVDRIESDTEVVPDLKIGCIDMVFFPICHAVEYFVVVLDFKRRTVVLLDSSSSMSDDPVTSKYGNAPSTLVKFFCEWLIAKAYIGKGRSLSNMPIQMLEMPWKDDENKVDSGVFAMRHMETYMGQRVKDWDTGLARNSVKNLQELRVKYCKVLLTCEANLLRKEILSSIAKWFKGVRHWNFNEFRAVLKGIKD